MVRQVADAQCYMGDWCRAAGGWLIGRFFGWLTFRMPANTKLAQTGDGLIATAATFVSDAPANHLIRSIERFVDLPGLGDSTRRRRLDVFSIRIKRRRQVLGWDLPIMEANRPTRGPIEPLPSAQ